MNGFRREKYPELVLRGGLELFVRHYEEIAWRRDKIRLNLAHDKYVQLEQAGILVCHTLRRDDALLAYGAWIVQNHLHYRDTKVAMNDVLYVSPERRHGGLGAEFIAACEEDLRELGVQVIGIHIKKVFDWGGLAARMGYEEVETTHQKWIGD